MGDAGIDYVCCGDHVSFFGLGFDGLVQATALAMLHPTLPVHVGVYLLPLRHPVLVARQLADFAGLDHAEGFFRLVLDGAHDGLLASGGDAGLSAASLSGPRLRLRQRSVNCTASTVCVSGPVSR